MGWDEMRGRFGSYGSHLPIAWLEARTAKTLHQQPVSNHPIETSFLFPFSTLRSLVTESQQAIIGYSYLLVYLDGHYQLTRPWIVDEISCIVPSNGPALAYPGATNQRP